MEKYEENSLQGMSRVKKNQSIYTNTDMSELSRIRTNNNVSVISDSVKGVDIEKIKRYVYSNDDLDETRKRISLELPPEEKIIVTRKEEKTYDINSVLETARDKREVDYAEDRHRKLNNTQIDILKRIKIKEEQQAAIDDDITGPIDELNTEEKTLVDLIKNIQINSKNNSKKADLLDELMGDSEFTNVIPPMGENNVQDSESLKNELIEITQDLESIKMPDTDFTQEINLEKEMLKKNYSQEEIKRINSDLDELDNEADDSNDDTDEKPRIEKIDDSFYTNSSLFDKSDFEGFQEIEKEAKKGSVFGKIVMVLIILMLLATIFLILNYILDWNII
jgi:hypothetical protein